MKFKNFFLKDLFYVIPVSIILGVILSSLEDGSVVIGAFVFGALTFLALMTLIHACRWAGGERTLAWVTGIAVVLRIIAGVAPYILLPINGYADSPDDRAGFIFTDAHRRDKQAWELAISDHAILDAFNEKYAYDQYGGLLAFSALVYRYLSPDAHRPLLLVLISAMTAALGIPFLWKAGARLWGENVALASCWIFALYPESVLLGGAAMREPYLMTLSAFALWGFANWLDDSHDRSAWMWLGAALTGMLLVSLVVALITIVIFAGWIWFTNEHRRVTWIALIIASAIFVVGLFALAWALNRSGNFGNGPINVLVNWTKEVVLYDTFRAERESGWLQKLFVGKPPIWRVTFMAIYGILQPVLPATLIAPTTLTWKVIGIIRALGWYMFLPALILSFVAAANSRSARSEARGSRRLWLWFAFLTWSWILIAALRAGGDQWDNPRYRVILLLWQSILAGHTLAWQREARSAWLWRIIAMEVVFLLFFGQWYATRYFQWDGQLPFGTMVAAILFSWVVIVAGSVWRDVRYNSAIKKTN